jgi:Bacterial RNA polymerase, alpha chain C terminal domain/T5orf172 domain
MPLTDEVARERHYAKGYVYIAGSLAGQVVKIGTTKNIGQRRKYLRNHKYGSLHDWEILYWVWVDEGAGRIEQDTLRLLRRHKTSRKYKKHWQNAREIRRCSFSIALKALFDSIGDKERFKEWQSNRCRYFEDKEHYESNVLNDLMREVKSLAPNEALANFLFFKNADELAESVRLGNCLKHNSIVYIGDLVQKTEAELRNMPNFDRKSLDEVKEALVPMGLHLGMEIPGWPPKNVESLARCFQTIFFEKVDELELSVLTAGLMNNNNIVYIADLVQKTAAEIRGVSSNKSFIEIEKILAQMGLQLGMDVPGWPSR